MNSNYYDDEFDFAVRMDFGVHQQTYPWCEIGFGYDTNFFICFHELDKDSRTTSSESLTDCIAKLEAPTA